MTDKKLIQWATFVSVLAPPKYLRAECQNGNIIAASAPTTGDTACNYAKVCFGSPLE